MRSYRLRAKLGVWKIRTTIRKLKNWLWTLVHVNSVIKSYEKEVNGYRKFIEQLLREVLGFPAATWEIIKDSPPTLKFYLSKDPSKWATMTVNPALWIEVDLSNILNEPLELEIFKSDLVQTLIENTIEKQHDVSVNVEFYYSTNQPVISFSGRDVLQAGDDVEHLVNAIIQTTLGTIYDIKKQILKSFADDPQRFINAKVTANMLEQ